ncbi:MAG: thiamine phosphate synthase [Caldilinea sp.]|nr:thiamine phosphate synthase [Caldilinea sp.]MDW8439653.1 thiamine phosphate synthase [Caldilineaceae bacterium]
MNLPEPPLLVITDRRMACRPLPAVVAEALAGGCRWLLVREKDLPRSALVTLVKEILDLARPYSARVSVSADAQAMFEAAAHGVHLPQGTDVQSIRARIGAAQWIGVSAHSQAEVEAAAAAGADYVTFSPIFLTQSKPGYGPALGLAMLQQTVLSTSIPVIALGGITAANAADCIEAGAAGVAVMGEIMRAVNPAAAVQRLVKSIQEGRARR